jgi:hypothetical protein
MSWAASAIAQILEGGIAVSYRVAPTSDSQQSPRRDARAYAGQPRRLRGPMESDGTFLGQCQQPLELADARQPFLDVTTRRYTPRLRALGRG